MTGRLQDKVVLITGAAQGIGAAYARACAAEGAAVGIIDLTRIDQAAEVEKDIAARLKGAEELAVSARGQGSYSLRVVRADGEGTVDGTSLRVDGRIELKTLDAGTRSLPFALAGKEVEVARIAVTMKPVLTPVSPWGGGRMWE